MCSFQEPFSSGLIFKAVKIDEVVFMYHSKTSFKTDHDYMFHWHFLVKQRKPFFRWKLTENRFTNYKQTKQESFQVKWLVYGSGDHLKRWQHKLSKLVLAHYIQMTPLMEKAWGSYFLQQSVCKLYNVLQRVIFFKRTFQKIL